MSHITHTLRLGLMVCLVVGLLPLPVLATEGWYASVKGGVTSGPDGDEEITPGLSGSFDTELGVALLGAVGYGLRSMDGFRVEGELSWRRNALDTLTLRSGFGTAEGTLDGSITNLAGMLNVVYAWQWTSLRVNRWRGVLSLVRSEKTRAVAHQRR